jgi:hypothetical protein
MILPMKSNLYEFQKASEFRHQAEELRNAALATKHKITRETLLKLAEAYDRMATYPAMSYPKKLPR